MSIDSKSQGGFFSGQSPFSFNHRLFRAIWAVVWLVGAAWTPAPLHKWRILLLRLFGAKVSLSARVYGSARIWYPPNLKVGKQSCLGPAVVCYCMGPIRIGDRVVISQRAHLCGGTHDVSDPQFQLVTHPITIEDFAWIAAEAFVGPGVTVAEGAVLGARGVTTKDLASWSIYAGNPACLIKLRRLNIADDANQTV